MRRRNSDEKAVTELVFLRASRRSRAACCSEIGANTNFGLHAQVVPVVDTVSFCTNPDKGLLPELSLNTEAFGVRRIIQNIGSTDPHSRTTNEPNQKLEKRSLASVCEYWSVELDVGLHVEAHSLTG